MIRLRKRIPIEYGRPLTRTMGNVAVHELGHFLGLPHRRGCSIMVVSTSVLGSGCHVEQGMVACGPQPVDVRAVARRYGWARGGRRHIRRAGFGRCSAPKEGGATPTRAVCGPAQLDLVRSGVTVTGALAFVNFPFEAGDGQAQCDWRPSDWRPGPQSRSFVVTVNLTTPANVFHDPSAGNCRGDRPDTTFELHSHTRYLTVRVSDPHGPLPVGGALPVLQSVLAAAEAAGVGLACADAR